MIEESLTSIPDRYTHTCTYSYTHMYTCMHNCRGVYCALVAALLTNTLTPQLFQNTDRWLMSCQTYEGGFSAVPGTEAHGGYTFCGFAAAVLLKATQLVDMNSLLVAIQCLQACILKAPVVCLGYTVLNVSTHVLYTVYSSMLL